MGIAQSRTAPAEFSAQKRPEFADLVKSLGDEAHRLARPARILGAGSLGAALLCWLLCFSSYSLDSSKSLALCMAFFAFALTPGLVFLWLGESLRQLEQLPRRLPREKVAQTTESAASPGPAVEAEAEAAQATSWLRKAKARVDYVLVLWEHLSFSKDEIVQLVGPSRSMAFLAHPASAFLVAAAFLIALFVTLGSIVALLANLLSRIF